ncbi:MAG: zinc-dependent alcohol dehydrogenase family protein [Myxococcota bacterium]
MRAYVLEGVGLDRLELVERPAPKLEARKVLLKMRAFSLNARDLQTVHGHYPINCGFPVVPLSDGVGEVVARGDSVTRFAVGERVAPIFAQRWLSGPRDADTWASTLASDLDGVLQEYVALHEDGLVRVPDHLSDVEAATLPTAGVAAWEALVSRGQVGAGDRVLVQGTGVVSLFALQFAYMLGAHVIVTSESAEKLEKARALGAWETVLRSDPEWPARVRELTSGRGVDHVVDVAGDLSASVACVRSGGCISQVGYLAKLKLEVDVFQWLLANARLEGVSVGPRASFEAMNEAISRHRLRPVIWRRFEFSRAREAYASLQASDRFGKVVLTL